VTPVSVQKNLHVVVKYRKGNVAEYINEEPCEFIYNVTAIEKVVDGDTIDAVIDLGFDVRYCGRVRLLGIDTPESRTRHKNEKIYGKWATIDDRDDIEIQVRCPEADSRGKFGRILGEIWINCTEDGNEFNGWTNINKWMCENGFAVGYTGQNKDDVKDEHWKNRLLLKEQGVHELLEWDED
jgi:micrococcal nuclease